MSNSPLERIISLTQDLIRFRSTKDEPLEILGCIEYIEAFLTSIGLPFQRLEFGNRPSVLVTPKSDSTPVLLMSHIDVVAGPDEVFEPRITDGRLFGRGAIDDKYAVALSLVLAADYARRLNNRGSSLTELPFGLLITSDEETGGRHGAGTVLDNIQADFCLVLDGGTPDTVVVKEKGILTLKLVATGRAAHGARPWQGENAIENLISDLITIKAHFPETRADHWEKTLTIGRIAGGRQFNQVPEQAEAMLDIRYTEADDPDDLLTGLKAEIRGRIEVIRQEPLFIGGESDHLARLLNLAPGMQTGFGHGGSDARYLTPRKIPGAVWGADGDESAHSVDEHVKIDSLAGLFGRLETFIDQTALSTGYR